MSDIKGKTLSFGGINTRDLAPQVENLTLKGGDGKIDATFSAVDAAYASLVKYYVVTANTHMPIDPKDGVSVMVMPGTGTLSCVLSGLTNGVIHHVRVFIRCTYGWQTSPMAYGVCTPMAGIAISTLAVGSEVKLNLGGVPYNHLIVQQGNPDATMYDTSCDGAWLLMKDIYENRQWHSSNVNDYANSTIHAYLNGEFIGKFDPAIQSAIKQVKIPYRPGSGTSSVINSGANGLIAKIFLLSCYELGWTQMDPIQIPIDGTKLDYFSLGTGAVANALRVAQLQDLSEYWHTRTASANGNTSTTLRVTDTGIFGVASAGNPHGIRPTLILPSDFLLAPDPNPDGSYSPLAA